MDRRLLTSALACWPLGRLLAQDDAQRPRHKISAGREILEWRRVNFHVALGFTAEVCDSVDYTTG